MKIHQPTGLTALGERILELRMSAEKSNVNTNESQVAKEVPAELADDLDMLRHFIAIENECNAALAEIQESVTGLEEARAQARKEKQAALARIMRALGDLDADLVRIAEERKASN